MIRFICKQLWAWHSCPQYMRKDYKAIVLEWLSLGASAALTVLTLFALLLIHNAML